jgi:two-component system cell cycle sensor histidine kinase/response regulator CckA
LVISDVIMPDLTALELEQRIRGVRPGLPILYMSGYSREEVIDRGLMDSGQGFIQKPFTATELAAVVAQELSTGRPVVGR